MSVSLNASAYKTNSRRREIHTAATLNSIDIAPMTVYVRLAKIRVQKLNNHTLNTQSIDESSNQDSVTHGVKHGT